MLYGFVKTVNIHCSSTDLERVELGLAFDFVPPFIVYSNMNVKSVKGSTRNNYFPLGPES